MSTITSKQWAEIFGNGHMETHQAAEITVSVGYGRVNLKQCICLLSSMLISPDFRQNSASASGRKMGAMTRTQVAAEEDAGILLSAKVALPVGSIINLTVKWMNGARPLRDGSLFFRLRGDGPLYQVMAMIPTDRDTICGDRFSIFTGNADLLTLADLQEAGIHVPPSYVDRFMDPQEITESFRLLQLAPERAPKAKRQQITTPTGIQMVEVAQAPRRRIIVRKPV